jgi:MFS family permease
MPAGTVVDRFNRASLIVFSMLLGAISVGLLAWFAVYYGFNLYLLIAAASAWSIGMELFRSSSNSILPDIVESGRLSRTNGVNRAISSTTGSIANATAGGPTLGVGVAEAFTGSSMMFAVSALAAAFFILPGTRQKEFTAFRKQDGQKAYGSRNQGGF